MMNKCAKKPKTSFETLRIFSPPKLWIFDVWLIYWLIGFSSMISFLFRLVFFSSTTSTSSYILDVSTGQLRLSSRNWYWYTWRDWICGDRCGVFLLLLPCFRHSQIFSSFTRLEFFFAGLTSNITDHSITD